MRTIVNHRAKFDTPECVADAADSYVTFLKQTGTTTNAMVPPSVCEYLTHRVFGLGNNSGYDCWC